MLAAGKVRMGRLARHYATGALLAEEFGPVLWCRPFFRALPRLVSPHHEIRRSRAMNDTTTKSAVRESASPGALFREAVAQEKPLQIAGTINAYAARLAQRSGFRAIYLSGG